jgi:hypothetical protein
MDYLFGPSRTTAKAAHNPWSKLSKADIDKYLTGLKKTECKRVAECLAAMAPLLEEAAQKIVEEEWRNSVLRQVKLGAAVVVILLLVGGVSLVAAVVHSDSYAGAAETVWGGLKQRFS